MIRIVLGVAAGYMLAVPIAQAVAASTSLLDVDVAGFGVKPSPEVVAVIVEGEPKLGPLTARHLAAIAGGLLAWRVL